MKIEWQNANAPSPALRLGMMFGDVRVPNRARRDRVAKLAESLNGLTLEQAETALEKLAADGLNAHTFLATNDQRSFRVSASGANGWDGVSFTVSDGNVVRNATVF